MTAEYPLLFKNKDKNRFEKHRQKALKAAEKASEILKKEYDADKVILFGSILDKDKFNLKSDIDLAVIGLADELYFKAYAQISRDVGEFSIDLLDFKDCRDSFKKEIVNNGVEL
ncbi:MAG: nucleotidyltransferase domain-containing protein [Halanaerobiales bacterium]|nr:nucleotidyltransferase domain-containing protein [Halanaerobiales bacterium]